MNTKVKEKFKQYPPDVALVLHAIRTLILQVAKQEGIEVVNETLKWGEPSYITDIGTTIRFDWKSKHPDHIYIYFNCKTKIVDTIKEVYGDIFTYEGNRAIVLTNNPIIPTKTLAQCIVMALTYKKIKHLPLLGF